MGGFRALGFDAAVASANSLVITDSFEIVGAVLRPNVLKFISALIWHVRQGIQNAASPMVSGIGRADTKRTRERQGSNKLPMPRRTQAQDAKSGNRINYMSFVEPLAGSRFATYMRRAERLMRRNVEEVLMRCCGQGRL